MCAFVKRSFVSHIGLGRLLLVVAAVTMAAAPGLPQKLAAAELPSYQWQTVVPDDEFLDIDIAYGIRINSFGDAVGRGRKLVSVDFQEGDSAAWEEGVDVQVVAFRYLNSPSGLDTSGYVESIATWGTLVDREKWPVTELPDGTWMRYPIIKGEAGRAWKIMSIRDINAHREMVGHARSYLYSESEGRYERATSTMIWITIDPDAEQGPQLSIVDLQPLLEAHESGIEWDAIRILGVIATNDSRDLAISYRPQPQEPETRGLYARYDEENKSYTVEDIGDLGHGTVFVWGMNNWGQIVGEAYIDSSTTRAFRWSPGDGQMEDLGCLLNKGRSYSRAINDWGQVVGASDKKRIGWNGLNETTAFRYSDGVGMVDLVNSTETTRGWARDINSNGDTIGNVTRDGVELPFVYTDETGFLDLEPLIENLPEVLGRLGAQRITDNGEIFLSHDQLPDGRTELVILRPITDEPGIQVTIVEPADLIVSGNNVPVTAEATSPLGIQAVTFFIEGDQGKVILERTGEDLGDDLWSATWDTPTEDFPDGPYTIRAVATDVGGASAEDSIEVWVQNDEPLQPQKMSIQFTESPSIFVGRNHWQASVTVTVSKEDGTELTGALVTGTWSDGKTETIESPALFQSDQIHRRINSVTFTVTAVELAGYIWEDGPKSITISSP